MATETIDIVIREDGSRVVKRNIADIGTQAKSTGGAVEFMKSQLRNIGMGDQLKTQMNATTGAAGKLRTEMAAGAVGAQLQAHHIQNLTFQLNDMAVGLASGQKPMTVLFQQGAQIGQIMQQAGTGVKGFVNELLRLAGLRSITVDAEAAATAKSAAASLASIESHAAQARAAVMAADTELALAEAQAAAASTALAEAAANEALAAAHVSVATAAEQLAVAEQAVATASQRAAAANAAAARTTIVAWTPLAAVLAVVTVAALTLFGAFKLFQSQVASTGELQAYTQQLGLTHAEMKKLKDVSVTFGDVMAGVWKTIADHTGLDDSLEGLKNYLIQLFKDVLRSAVDTFAEVYGAIVGTYRAAIVIWQNFPAALGDVFFSAINKAIDAINKLLKAGVDGVNSFISTVNGVLGTNIGKLGEVSVQGVENSYAGAAKRVVHALHDETTRARNEARTAANAIIKETEANIVGASKNRLKKQADEIKADRDPKKGSDANKQTREGYLSGVNRDLDDQIKLTGILDEQWRQVQGQIDGVNKHLRDSHFAELTKDETTALAAKMQQLQHEQQVMQARDAIYKRFVGPQKDFKVAQEAANQLLAAGTITLEQHTQAMEDARLALLAINTDAASGLERGLIRVEQMARDEAGRMEQALVGAYQNIRGPQLQFDANMAAANKLLEKGKITGLEYAQAVRDIRIAYLQTKTDMASGLELGRLSVQRDNDNVGARVADAYKNAYGEANGELQELMARESALKQLMVDDPINSGRYAQQLGVVSAQLRALQPGAGFFDQMRAGLADFVQDFKGVLPGLRQAWTQTFQKIGDGVANALARAVVYGENLGDALKNVAREALTELIAALVKLGIQWLVMQVIGTAAQTTIAATGVAAGAAVTAAWVPAAAAVSLATFGANAAPAMTGIATTFALTNALAMASGKGGFREGGYTGAMGRDDVAGFVHGQEYVFDAESVSRLGIPFLEALRSGRGYRNGGYVKPLGSSTATGGSFGRMAPADVSSGDRGGLTVNIDARGAQAGVEEKIRDVLEEYEPVLLDKARKNAAKDRAYEAKRQKIGG